MKRFFPTNIWFSTDHCGSWVHWRQPCSPGKSHKWLWAFTLFPLWLKGQNALKSFKLWSSDSVTLKNFRFLFAVPPREHAESKKNISAKSCACLFFRWPFQCSTTFESIICQKFTSLLSVSEFFLMLCKFSVFDGRYLFTIVHCHRASSASCVCAVFVNNKRSPHFSHVF